MRYIRAWIVLCWLTFFSSNRSSFPPLQDKWTRPTPLRPAPRWPDGRINLNITSRRERQFGAVSGRLAVNPRSYEPRTTGKTPDFTSIMFHCKTGLETADSIIATGTSSATSAYTTIANRTPGPRLWTTANGCDIHDMRGTPTHIHPSTSRTSHVSDNLYGRPFSPPAVEGTLRAELLPATRNWSIGKEDTLVRRYALVKRTCLDESATRLPHTDRLIT
jgi:hypothetical protein